MTHDIYQFRDYRQYIEGWIDACGRKRGVKAIIATTAGCHSTYVSQVLQRRADFSLEQADRLNPLLGNSGGEAEYFLLMVQLARAGTSSLRSYFNKKIDDVLDGRKQIGGRLKLSETLGESQRTTYYSAWYFAAIHALVSTRQFQTGARIASALGLSSQRVYSALNALTEMKLIQQDGDRFEPATTSMHLNHDSPHVTSHHKNWRIRTLEKLNAGLDANRELLYSSVVTISKDDALRIREMVMDEIGRVKQVIRQSPEETMYAFNVDFYSLIGE